MLDAPASMLQHALRYHALGWSPVPLIHRSDTGRLQPRVKWKDITRVTSDDVTRWWSETPDAGIGCLTGHRSGIVVLDLDMKNGKDGEAALRQLEETIGPLPATAEAITPSGGRHLFFASDDLRLPSSLGGLGDGLDFLAERRVVNLPPTKLADGSAYAWRRSPWM